MHSEETITIIKDTEGNEKKFLHKFADFTNKRVLEIGCSEGRLTWKSTPTHTWVTPTVR